MRKKYLILPFILICVFFFSLFLSCTKITTSIGLCSPIWSDDGSEIVLAVNKSDDRDELFGNYEENIRYDLKLCDSTGVPYKELYSNRKLDGNDTEVYELFYMKKEGYIIVKNVVNNSNIVIEKVSLDGISTLIAHSIKDNLKVIPSPTGKILLISTDKRNAATGTVTYTTEFLDAGTLLRIGGEQQLSSYGISAIRWVNDSTVQYIRDLVTKELGPFTDVHEIPSPLYWYPATSSSVYNKKGGFIDCEYGSEKIIFDDSIGGDYDKWDLSKR